MAQRSRRKKPHNINSSEAGSDHEAGVEQAKETVVSAEATKELCPMCDVGGKEDALTSISKEDWVRCDACKVWFHWRCAGEGGDLEVIDKW